MTTKIKRWRWPPDAVEVLHSLWGKKTPEVIAAKLRRDYGAGVTPMAVRMKAHREGLDYRDAQGDLTLTDAACELGLSVAGMYDAMRVVGVKPYGNGKGRFITQEDLAALKKRYPPAPWPTVSTADAAMRLKIHPDTVLWHIEAGNLTGHRFGQRWLVKTADVERLFWDRAKRCG